MLDPRQQALNYWLKAELNTDFNMTPVIGDASFRRYFRVTCDGKTFIAVDAPPNKENSHSFIAVGRAFAAIEVNVPQVFSFDLRDGFLLLSDFGTELYQYALNAENADELYTRSLKELAKIQACQTIADWTLPQFDQTFMLEELSNFRHWFLERHLQIPLDDHANKLLDELFEQLINSAITQPQCCIHRDYHSRNLMVLPEGIGVLDFQDAAKGPITYDLVSLLRDCYIAWPRQKVEQWALSFYEGLIEKNLLTVSWPVFLRWFDWMGIQRHLKAIFIFARKYYRDGVADYLPYIANGLQYVVDVSRNYPELQTFANWLDEELLPRYETVKRV